MTEEEWQHLYENFETTDLLRAVDAVDSLRDKRIEAVAVIAIVVAIAGCNDGYLRGSVSKSTDGKTYFAVIDDNGGHCGPSGLASSN